MFRESVTAPISPIPDAYIRNSINRITREPDYSLTCLGIAILKNRIENYAGFSGIYTSYERKAACMDHFAGCFGTADNYPMFCYYIYNTGHDAEVPEALAEFKDKTQVGQFVKEKTNVECQILYHETKNIVGIFVNSRDMKIYHLLLSFISLYYPNLFSAIPMTDKDFAVVKSLSKPDKSVFYEAVKNAVKPYEAEFRRMQLSTLLKDMHDFHIQKAIRDVDRQRNIVSEAEESYAEAIRYLHDLIVTLEGIKATEVHDDAEEDLVEYLTNNKFVNNLNIRDNTIYFDVATTLINYNEDVWRIFSERGHIYDGNYRAELPDIFKKRENIKLLLDNIFSESPKLVVKMCGNYSLNMRDCRVRTESGYDYINADPMYKSYIPNPHLKLFSCLGGYSDKVMNALLERNFIGAIELCVASAGSINLEETDQNFRPFLGWLLTSKEKVLRTKNGTEMTPEEALVWLHDEVK